ncbi:MAG TPA: sulfurtransferase TusA family protein [Gemmatimonadales bacterium]|nr:sulfurtransferase TusA family protein [Gemmatimonadales bacterium]
MNQPATIGDVVVADTLDTSGLLCPLPVYKAAMALARLAPGEILRLICTDPGSLEDIPALARQRGDTLLSSSTVGNTQVFLLEKGAGG